MGKIYGEIRLRNTDKRKKQASAQAGQTACRNGGAGKGQNTQTK